MGAVKRKCDDISRDNHEQVLPGVAHDNDVQADGPHRGHVQADARDDPTRLHDHRGAQRPDNQEEDAQRNQAEDARRPQRTHAQVHTSDDAGRLHDTVEEIEAGITIYAGAVDHLDLGQNQPGDDHESSDGEFSSNLEETIENARQVYNNYTRAIWRREFIRCGGCMRCAVCLDDNVEWIRLMLMLYGSTPEG